MPPRCPRAPEDVAGSLRPFRECRTPFGFWVPEVDEYRQVLVVPRFDRAEGVLDVLLRHGLPRQSRSLERLGPVAVDIDAAYLSVAHTEGSPPVQVERYAARLPFTYRVYA